MFAYHSFIEAFLSKYVQVNEILQNEKSVVTQNLDVMSQLYVNLLKMYLNESYILKTEIHEINLELIVELKNLSDIDLGRKTKLFLESISIDIDDATKNEFRKTCLSALVEGLKNLKKNVTLTKRARARAYFIRKMH